MQPPKKPGLDKLSSLLSGSPPSAAPARPAFSEPTDLSDEKLSRDVEKVLTFAQKLAGDNVFDLQTLIETCAEELRDNIRDMVEGGEDE